MFEKSQCWKHFSDGKSFPTPTYSNTDIAFSKKTKFPGHFSEKEFLLGVKEFFGLLDDLKII